MVVKTSGVVGTFYDKSKSKWEAFIKVNYKKHRFGYFEKLQDAVIARYQAEQKFDRVKKEDLFGAYQWLREKKLLNSNENVIE